MVSSIGLQHYYESLAPIYNLSIETYLIQLDRKYNKRFFLRQFKLVYCLHDTNPYKPNNFALIGFKNKLTEIDDHR